MIIKKTDKEIEIMQRGGKILSQTMDYLIGEVAAGISLSKLDEKAEEMIKSLGGEPSFKKVRGYKWTICACLNDVVVHGIPTDEKLKRGDVIGIDCGVYYQGFHTDCSWSTIVEENNQDRENRRFLDAGEKALFEALQTVKSGNHIYDVSKAIQTYIEGSNYSVVKSLVGHGIGRNLHEDPEIPGFTKKARLDTPVITPGMVLAIEVIYNMGGDAVYYKGSDGWTIATKDAKISGLFEITVAVGDHGSIVLTPTQNVKKWGGGVKT